VGELSPIPGVPLSGAVGDDDGERPVAPALVEADGIDEDVPDAGGGDSDPLLGDDDGGELAELLLEELLDGVEGAGGDCSVLQPWSSIIPSNRGPAMGNFMARVPVDNGSQYSPPFHPLPDAV
jgi:hypothetical protein